MTSVMKTIVLAFMMAQAAAAAPVPEIPQEAIEEPAPVYEYVGDYRVTAYAYYEGGGENYATASGMEPIPYYTVATNDEFEFGTVLWIEGIGEVMVMDRGNFQEGIIDLLIGDDPMSSFEDGYRKVYIVKKGESDE